MNSVFKSALFQCTDDGNVSTTCGGYLACPRLVVQRLS